MLINQKSTLSQSLEWIMHGRHDSSHIVSIFNITLLLSNGNAMYVIKWVCIGLDRCYCLAET